MEVIKYVLAKALQLVEFSLENPMGRNYSFGTGNVLSDSTPNTLGRFTALLLTDFNKMNMSLFAVISDIVAIPTHSRN